MKKLMMILTVVYMGIFLSSCTDQENTVSSSEETLQESSTALGTVGMNLNDPVRQAEIKQAMKRSAANEQSGMSANRVVLVGTTVLDFEDLEASAHVMISHNPYHGVTFGPNDPNNTVAHFDDVNYGHPHSGTHFLLNYFGYDAYFMTFASPVTFQGLWVGKPHGGTKTFWLEGYLNGTLQWTSAVVTLDYTMQWLSGGSGKVDKVVFRVNEPGVSNTWWVVDDINFDEGCTPTQQTFTIYGGNGVKGDIDPYTQASTDGGTTWNQAFLTGGHPWGYVSGTNSWVNFDPDNTVGLNSRTPYRIRFTVPEDFSNPSMLFQLKADNRAIFWINDTYIDSVDGQGTSAVDATIAGQALHVGLNEIRIMLVDWGGIVGLNYRIDVTMTSCEDLTNAVLTPDEAAALNNPPVADAGPDQSVDVSSVTLDGSGSSDPDGNILSYTWSENGTTIATGENPTVTFANGVHTIVLTVSDAELTDSDTVIVTVAANTPPVANAGEDQAITCGAPVGNSVMLNGAGSTDADADNLNYNWSWTGGTATGATPTISLPNGSTTITLTVDDGNGGTDSDEMVVSINAAPLANAGTDQTISCGTATGNSVTLSGSGTDADGDNLTYAWSWSGGSATGANPTISLPNGTTIITLTVDDGNSCGSNDQVSISINAAPTANAGPAQTVECAGNGTTVTLDGSGTDPDGDNLTYSWSWNGGTASGQDPQVSLPLGTTVLTLTVDDGNSCGSTDQVLVTVEDTQAPSVSMNLTKTVLWPPNHKMVTVSNNISASDICCDLLSFNVTVTSSEGSRKKDYDDDGKKDDDDDDNDHKKHRLDYLITQNSDGSYRVDLRAERNGESTGRTYTITAVAIDCSGNETTTIGLVTVPHDQRDDKKEDGKKDDDKKSKDKKGNEKKRADH